MYYPTAQSQHQLAGLVPCVISWAADDTLPIGVGGFRLSSYYSGKRSKLSRRQFTGRAKLNLHDPTNGEAAVAISDIASLSLAYVTSTGHDVVVPELQRPNLLVPVTGTLSSRNEHTQRQLAGEPWILFGRGTRITTTLPSKEARYQAFVLSIPPQLLGDRLASVEALGGMVCGATSRNEDLLLVRLLLALATQVSLTTDMEMNRRLAGAWTTVVIDQMNRCLDAQLTAGKRDASSRAKKPSYWYVRRAEQLIHDRPNEIRSLRDIALHVGISERTLQAAFRKVRGATPMQALAQAKLHCARQALLDRDGPKTISDVCSLCGIEHHGRFSKRYKEAFGEKPITTLNARMAL